MSRDILWAMDVAEAMQDFFTSELTSQSVLELMQQLNLGAFEVTSAPMSAARIVLVHGNTDHSFTSDEIEWLAYAPCVIMANLEKEISFFAMEVECAPDEYYINSAALIKIFNLAFPGSNIFLFKMGQAMALGSMRFFSEDFPDNFCITDRIDASNINCLAELIYDLSYEETESIPNICAKYSPQEEGQTQNVYRHNILELSEEDYYDEDQTDYELGSYNRYTLRDISNGPLDNDANTKIAPYTYKQVCSLLKDVAAYGSSSSYDELDLAIEAEEKALLRQSMFSTSSDTDTYDQPEPTASLFSQNAYDNAEAMLQEMNHNNSKPINDKSLGRERK